MEWDCENGNVEWDCGMGLWNGSVKWEFWYGIVTIEIFKGENGMALCSGNVGWDVKWENGVGLCNGKLGVGAWVESFKLTVPVLTQSRTNSLKKRLTEIGG